MSNPPVRGGFRYPPSQRPSLFVYPACFLAPNRSPSKGEPALKGVGVPAPCMERVLTGLFVANSYTSGGSSKKKWFNLKGDLKCPFTDFSIPSNGTFDEKDWCQVPSRLLFLAPFKRDFAEYTTDKFLKSSGPSSLVMYWDSVSGRLAWFKFSSPVFFLKAGDPSTENRKGRLRRRFLPFGSKLFSLGGSPGDIRLKSNHRRSFLRFSGEV